MLIQMAHRTLILRRLVMSHGHKCKCDGLFRKMGDILNLVYVYSVHSGAINIEDPRSLFLVIIKYTGISRRFLSALMVHFPAHKLPRGYRRDRTLPRIFFPFTSYNNVPNKEKSLLILCPLNNILLLMVLYKFMRIIGRAIPFSLCPRGFIVNKPIDSIREVGSS